MTPNNCVRFIYGQGCYGCAMTATCWPTTASSSSDGVTPHVTTTATPVKTDPVCPCCGRRDEGTTP